MTAIKLSISISQEALAAILASGAVSVPARRPHPMAALIAAIQGAAEAQEGGETDLARDFAEMRFAVGNAVAEEERSETPPVSTANLRDTINGFLADTSKYVWRSKAAIVKYLGQVYSDMPPRVLEELLNSLWNQMQCDGDIESRFAPVSGKEQFRAA